MMATDKKENFNRIANARLEKITKSIHEGLKENGHDDAKIYILIDVKKAYPLIDSLKKKKDIYALFENDLPDNYNE